MQGGRLPRVPVSEEVNVKGGVSIGPAGHAPGAAALRAILRPLMYGVRRPMEQLCSWHGMKKGGEWECPFGVFKNVDLSDEAVKEEKK